MSVLIKGMTMPSCCDDCWALDEYGDYPVCRITEEQRGYNFRIREKRMDKCPLVSILPHGDLIDAEEQMRLMRACEYDTYDDYNRAFDMLDNAPIIIEEEEEQE